MKRREFLAAVPAVVVAARMMPRPLTLREMDIMSEDEDIVPYCNIDGPGQLLSYTEPLARKVFADWRAQFA